tara:strand:- start:489 stop:758 length:270 start_codon:yes stop_codon:yes gene_type:complete
MINKYELITCCNETDCPCNGWTFQEQDLHPILRDAIEVVFDTVCDEDIRDPFWETEEGVIELRHYLEVNNDICDEEVLEAFREVVSNVR